MLPLSLDEPRVIYIEDDLRLGRLTAKYLERHGVQVSLFTEPRAALVELSKLNPDVILLDLLLPGMHGLRVCQEIRARHDTPIIMVTALGEEADRVMGLEGGADDYLVKPFSPRELLARIRAQTRRARLRLGPPRPLVSQGPLSLDSLTRRVTLRGVELNLTTYEFDLLRIFAERPGRVLSREQLVEFVRGASDESFDRAIDVHVSHLRRKLNDDPKRPQMLKTVRGVGYVFTAEGE